MKINLISEWGNVVSNVRNNIVFENRNQAYGAYFIRREYPRTMFFSLFVTVSVIVLGVAGLKLSSYLSAKIVEVIVPVTNTPIEIITPVDLKPLETPPVKVEPMKTSPPPKGTEFTAPVVSDDKEKIEEKPFTQEEIKPGRVDGVDTTDVEFIPETPKGKGTIVAIDTVEKVLDFVDVNPCFPGGEAKMYEFISQKTKYPSQEKENGISGTVYVSFTVDKAGKIKDVVIERGVTHGPNLAKEAQRVISLMPEWKPGIYKGQTVAVRYRMPISFVLR